MERGKTLPYKMICTELKDMLIFILYRSPYVSQLIICHSGMDGVKTKKDRIKSQKEL